MKMTRSDPEMKSQQVREFDVLVSSIIQIHKKTQTAFKGANTIQVKDFIGYLIKSTDVTSDVPCQLRTQSLKIIRKVIESENKQSTLPAKDWETEDWEAYKVQIADA